MAAPITWQNVNEPSGARAAAPILQGAVQGVNGAFDIFSRLIQQRQGIDQANAAAIDDANKQVYLDRLASAKTPEELAALQASGQLDTLRQGLTATARGAVRGADEARTTSVRQNTVAENEFNDKLLARKEAPLLAQYNTLVAAGKASEAAAFQAANAGNVRDWSNALNAGRATTLGIAKDAVDLRGAQFNLATAPQRENNQRGALTLAGTRQTVEQGEASNQVEDQLITRLIASGAEARKRQTLASRAAVAKYVGGLGIRIGEDGLPDLSGKTSGEIQVLNAELEARGLPSITKLTRGDTAAQTAFLKALPGQPGVSAAGIERNLSKINSAFNTVATGAPVGNDALAVATRQAQADVVQKEKDARNRFAPGSADALNAYEQLAQTIKSEIPGNVTEDLPAIQGLLYRLSTKGLEIKPGVFITPSVQDILGEFRGYDRWNFFNATQAKDIEENLRRTLGKEDVTKLVQQAEESRMANRQRDVRNLLNPLTPAQAPLNPLNIPQAPGKK